MGNSILLAKELSPVNKGARATVFETPTGCQPRRRERWEGDASLSHSRCFLNGLLRVTVRDGNNIFNCHSVYKTMIIYRERKREDGGGRERDFAYKFTKQSHVSVLVF